MQQQTQQQTQQQQLPSADQLFAAAALAAPCVCFQPHTLNRRVAAAPAAAPVVSLAVAPATAPRVWAAT